MADSRGRSLCCESTGAISSRSQGASGHPEDTRCGFSRSPGCRLPREACESGLRGSLRTAPAAAALLPRRWLPPPGGAHADGRATRLPRPRRGVPAQAWPQASGGEMALLAQRIPRWLSPVKVRLVISVAPLTTGVPKRQVPLLRGTRAQPQRGFGPSRTYSFGASVPPAHSGSPETDAAPSALQPPESQPSHARPDMGSALPLEELDDAPPRSPLQPVSEEEAARIVAVPPSPPSSFTLRDYVDHSETLRRLVLLGVDLTRIEKRADAANLLLRLDFEKDIRRVLLFLKDLGLEDHQLGPFLSKNYAIFSEDLEDLKTRVAYLRSKAFSQADITQMVRNAPFLLSFSVERLDNRLGFFQKELELSVKKTRDLVVRLPRLLTGSLEPVKENMKVYSLELGFKRNEIQHMVTRIPKMLTASKRRLTETFDYVHNEMGVPHHLMVKFPQVFNSRLFKVKERHLFLRYLGRAQYDPTKPSYVSLDKLVSLPDEAFCRDIAKASVQDLETFLKTL